MEQQLQKIQDIRLVLHTQRLQIDRMSNLYKLEQEYLKELCGKETGHTFVRESDGDFHKPTYTNICSECRYESKRN
jgi:hypothetical protein